MKLQDLLESPPDFIDKEMPVVNVGTVNFYSQETIGREFTVVGKVKSGDKEYWIILKKDKSFAAIGELCKRKEDHKIGLQLIGKLDFKVKPDLSFDKEIPVPGEVLQVDSVEVFSESRFRGFGFNLYKSLVEVGYIIVSDHLQYRGGRKLWEKIAKLSNAGEYSVYIIDNGHPVVDGDGKPLEYNGTNIADEKIWASPSSDPKASKRYVLLMMKKN